MMIAADVIAGPGILEVLSYPGVWLILAAIALIVVILLKKRKK